ncbi:MAG: metal ABC transporter substrate-binding protein [Lachnospiraceae bacterium]|nr:metal ABC transporter substrate-binding protein [Lachnospiraceae bacterium]
MHNKLSMLLCLTLAAGLFNCCSIGAAASDGDSDAKTLSIVTTLFPEYDWVKQILGETVEQADLTMLLDSGVDLHSYQPTVEDLVTISNCDLFIYVGGESDDWVEEALETVTNADMTVINLLDVLGDSVKEEEVVEGMEAEEEDEDAGNDEEETEYDEHVWLSLKNAEVICQYICDRLCEMDEVNADTYAANTQAYLEELDALDTQYEEAVSAATCTTLLFGDRFPFRYLADDYGLDYYAAFSGCSAESEASFETIAFLAGKVDELGLTTVLTIDGTDHSIAETIVSTASSDNIQILSMDSMQSTVSADVEAGATYLSLMESNLDVLTQALN